MKRLLLIVVWMAVLAAAAPASTRRFYRDDPIQREPETQDASNVQPWTISLTYDSLLSVVEGREDPPFIRAQDINTVDEVPDSSWFVDRAPMTPEQVTRGVDEDTGPAPGKWTVRSGKGNGVSPGFTIVDTRGRRYFVKFDPPGWNELATGAEVVVTRLYHALGYFVPQTNIAYIRREDLVLGEGATTTGPNGKTRAMEQGDIDSNLRRAAHLPDGQYRALVSEALAGKALGGFKYEGTRPDDPNDIVPHENRRSLRALRVFGAWVNHTDAKAINTLDTLVSEGGRTVVRHHLLDFGSTLGSAGIGPRDRREGFEYVLETAPIKMALPTLGASPRAWMKIPYPDYKRIGRFESAEFDPDEWKPRFPNAAFRNARPDDLFWGARRLKMLMSDEVIRAAVKAGRFSDPRTEELLVKMLAERRDKIARAWLVPVNPIVDVALGNDELTFRNAAVDLGVAEAAATYTAVWSRFDNETGAVTRLAETSGSLRMKAPDAVSRAGDFVQIEIGANDPAHAEWAAPVRAWFRRAGGGWTLAGFQRLADAADVPTQSPPPRAAPAPAR